MMDQEFHRILDGIAERWAGAFREMAEWRQDEPTPYACDHDECTVWVCIRYVEVD